MCACVIKYLGLHNSFPHKVFSRFFFITLAGLLGISALPTSSAWAQPVDAQCALQGSNLAYSSEESRGDINCEGKRYIYSESISTNVLGIWQTRAGQAQNEILIGFRGTADLGDVGRDFQSLTTSRISNPYCQRSGQLTVGRGWAARVRNQSTLRGLLSGLAFAPASITVTGHSLGAVSAQLAGHFISECFSNPIKIVAFNPPRMTSNSRTLNTMAAAARASHVRWLQFSHVGDPVSSLPSGMQHIIFTPDDNSCVGSGNIMRHRSASPGFGNIHSLDSWSGLLSDLGC